MSPTGISLDEHLGRAKHYIDVMLARSPEGAIAATRPLKYEYPGNWKFQMENMSDNYHAIHVHASAFAGTWASSNGTGNDTGNGFTPNGAPGIWTASSGAWRTGMACSTLKGIEAALASFGHAGTNDTGQAADRPLVAVRPMASWRRAMA